jgi:N6-adenosine-specific RNA methylase IME4
LEEALQVIAAWGFSYKSNVVWVKDKIGLGYLVRNQHELLLIATRGSMPCPLPANRPSSVIAAPRREHSRKPDEAYELIERMYPDCPSWSCSPAIRASDGMCGATRRPSSVTLHAPPPRVEE